MNQFITYFFFILLILKHGNGKKKSQYFLTKPEDIIAKAGENVSIKKNTLMLLQLILGCSAL